MTLLLGRERLFPAEFEPGLWINSFFGTLGLKLAAIVQKKSA